MRLYETLRTIKLTTDPPRNVRVTMLYLTTNWDRVWSNLHATWAPDAMKVNWFKVIHDILPNNERLHAIRLTSSALCSTCGERDNVMHRITMWLGAGNLGMDEGTHLLDITHRCGLDPQRVDRPTAVQALATATPWGSTLDTHPHSVVQDTWVTVSVSAGVSRLPAQSPLEGVSGLATCEQSRELSNNPLSDHASAPKGCPREM